MLTNNKEFPQVNPDEGFLSRIGKNKIMPSLLLLASVTGLIDQGVRTILGNKVPVNQAHAATLIPQGAEAFEKDGQRGYMLPNGTVVFQEESTFKQGDFSLKVTTGGVNLNQDDSSVGGMVNSMSEMPLSSVKTEMGFGDKRSFGQLTQTTAPNGTAATTSYALTNSDQTQGFGMALLRSEGNKDLATGNAENIAMAFNFQGVINPQSKIPGSYEIMAGFAEQRNLSIGGNNLNSLFQAGNTSWENQLTRLTQGGDSSIVAEQANTTAVGGNINYGGLGFDASYYQQGSYSVDAASLAKYNYLHGKASSALDIGFQYNTPFGGPSMSLRNFTAEQGSMPGLSGAVNKTEAAITLPQSQTRLKVTQERGIRPKAEELGDKDTTLVHQNPWWKQELSGEVAVNRKAVLGIYGGTFHSEIYQAGEAGLQVLDRTYGGLTADYHFGEGWALNPKLGTDRQGMNVNWTDNKAMRFQGGVEHRNFSEGSQNGQEWIAALRGTVTFNADNYSTYYNSLNATSNGFQIIDNVPTLVRETERAVQTAQLADTSTQSALEKSRVRLPRSLPQDMRNQEWAKKLESDLFHAQEQAFTPGQSPASSIRNLESFRNQMKQSIQSLKQSLSKTANPTHRSYIQAQIDLLESNLEVAQNALSAMPSTGTATLSAPTISGTTVAIGVGVLGVGGILAATGLSGGSKGSEGAAATAPDAADTDPENLTFNNPVGVGLNSLNIWSNNAISDINTATAISVSGDGNPEYRITRGGSAGAWTNAAGTVLNGDVVDFRHTAAGTYNSSVTSTFTIGTDTYNPSSTTLSDPDA